MAGFFGAILTEGNPPDVQHDFMGGTLPSWITFSRSSNSWYFNSSGVLTQASANAARFDYYPVTLTARGMLLEDSRTNAVLYNRDLTQASVWTASNITAAKDQTGLDGVSNSASSIVAGASNGTILQAITLASSARYQTAYCKRLVGSGTIYMTMDGGTTWVDVTSQIGASWARVSIPSQTVTNPSVGFKIATSGDKIAVDGFQNENGAFGTSVILTGASTYNRTQDIAYLTGAAATIAQAASGTAIMQIGALEGYDGTNLNYFLTSGANRRLFYSNSSDLTKVQTYNGTSVLAATLGSGSLTTSNCRFGLAWGASSMSLAGNNGSVATGAYALGSTASQTNIGSNSAGSNHMNGWLASMALYTNRITDAQLKYKTSVGAPY